MEHMHQLVSVLFSAKIFVFLRHQVSDSVSQEEVEMFISAKYIG